MSLLGGFGAVVFVILAIIGAAIEHKFRGDLFFMAFIWLVVTVTLRALSHGGNRLTRIEAGQLGIIQELERGKRDNKG